MRAGLVAQERTGRISRCSLTAGPIFDAAVWLNRYSKYWQAQFDLLAASPSCVIAVCSARTGTSLKISDPVSVGRMD